MEQAILYILYSPVHKAIKIGISDISGRRFASHRQKGWILVKYWHFFERDKARTFIRGGSYLGAPNLLS
jgi:hypothetical protein